VWSREIALSGDRETVWSQNRELCGHAFPSNLSLNVIIRLSFEMNVSSRMLMLSVCCI